MAVTLGTQGQPGFDQPLELMSDCHRRIEHFLGVIRRVLDQFSTAPLDEQAERALQTAQHYFRVAAPRHTEDEEQSLFPRLRALDQPDIDDLLDEAERLEQEHTEAERLHSLVDQRIQRWLHDRRLTSDDVDSMRTELDLLHQLYTRHIAFEDNTLFPAAARLLDVAALKDIGCEMAARRGQSVSDPLSSV